MRKKYIIFLAGFMATGKSTIGPILANTLGWDYFDLDKVIEEISGEKIKDVFKESGEKSFRKLESKVLLGLEFNNDSIVSIGGGTMLSNINTKFMKKTGTIILIKTTFDVLFKRLKNKYYRPLILTESGNLLNDSQLKIKINELLKERRKYFDKADLTVNIKNEKVGKSVDRIVEIINTKIKNHEKN